MGFIQSVEDLTRTKKLSEREFFPCLTVSWDVGLFWPLDLDGNISSSWISSLLAFGLELPPLAPGSQAFWPGLELCFGYPGSPTCWLQVLGLLSLHNHWSQFLIINPFITHTHILLALFLWRTLTNAVSASGRKGIYIYFLSHSKYGIKVIKVNFIWINFFDIHKFYIDIWILSFMTYSKSFS